MKATPEMIAAAWAAWHKRHGGKLGPGPAFVEAINAALTVLTSAGYRIVGPDERASPEMIAAAWATWHKRHGGKLGPGPAFVEAINAALAALKGDRNDG